MIIIMAAIGTVHVSVSTSMAVRHNVDLDHDIRIDAMEELALIMAAARAAGQELTAKTMAGSKHL